MIFHGAVYEGKSLPFPVRMVALLIPHSIDYTFISHIVT
jgi:hypothetical protein